MPRHRIIDKTLQWKRGGLLFWIALFFAGVTFANSPTSAQTSEPAAAQKQFVTSCAVCHAVEPAAPPRQGPNLSDRFGKPAGTLTGFAYSESLKTSGFVWDEETLDRWITDSQAMRPGVTMLYRQADPAKRRLIIDYLKTLSGKS